MDGLRVTNFKSNVKNTVKKAIGEKNFSTIKPEDIQFLDALPDYEKIQDIDVAGVKISKLFEDFYNAKSPAVQTKFNLGQECGIEEIDLQFKQEAYVRFISQFAAYLTKAGVEKSIQLQKGFSLADWTKISEILGDSGNNLNVPNLVGVRADGAVGAVGGGLGNKISQESFNLIVKNFKSEGLAQDKKKLLEDKLIASDNVVQNDHGEWEFVPFASAEAEKVLEVKLRTAGRELLEESLEVILLDYMLDQTLADKGIEGFYGKLQEVFGLDSLSEESKDLFKAMYVHVNSGRDMIKGGKTKDLKGNDLRYKELYKDLIEPLFAKFLKVTKEGKTLMNEIKELKGDEISVTDLSFPKDRFGTIDVEIQKAGDNPTDAQKQKAALSLMPGQGGFPVAIPQSSCFEIKKPKDGKKTMLWSLIAAAEKSSAKEQMTKMGFVVEAKGLIKSSLVANIMRLANYDSPQKDSKVFYPHEGLMALLLSTKELAEQAGKDELLQARNSLDFLVPKDPKQVRSAGFVSAMKFLFEAKAKFNGQALSSETDVKKGVEDILKFVKDAVENRLKEVEGAKDRSVSAVSAGGRVDEKGAGAANAASSARAVHSYMSPTASSQRKASSAAPVNVHSVVRRDYLPGGGGPSSVAGSSAVSMRPGSAKVDASNKNKTPSNQ